MKVFVTDGTVIEVELIGKYLKPSYRDDAYEEDYTYQLELSNHCIVERSRVFLDKEKAEQWLRKETAERQLRDIEKKKEELKKALEVFTNDNKNKEIEVSLNDLQVSLNALNILKLKDRED